LNEAEQLEEKMILLNIQEKQISELRCYFSPPKYFYFSPFHLYLIVNGIINGFMKVSGQDYLKLLSYDLSKFFFEELKKLSPPKLNHILGQRRQQMLRLDLIFNPTTQFFVVLKNRGARAKLKFLKFWPGNFTFV